MNTLQLFSPEFEAKIGGYTFTQGLELEIHSSRDSLFDWAKLRFTGAYEEEVAMAHREEGELLMGYDGSLVSVFQGYVSQPYSGGNANEVILKDAMLLLEDTQVNNTFLDTTPQEMIRYGLGLAGISTYQLAGQTYPERRRVPIRNMSIRSMLQEIHSIWGIHPTFFFSDGVFYWGEEPEQLDLYRFEYGVNILSLTRRGGSWEMETVAAPFVRHSHIVEVDHPQLTGAYRVQKVDFSSTDAGFLRTVITF